MTGALKPPLAEMGQRERNKIETERRIVGAARELFHRKGFDKTTTQEVADQAGVAAGTLFRYASGKEDLLILAFIDEMVEVVRRAFDALDRGAPFTDQVVGFFRGILAYHLADPPLSKYLLREVAVLRNPERAGDLRRLGIAPCLAQIIEQAQAEGRIRHDLAPAVIGRLMFASYWDCLRDWSNGELDDQGFGDQLRGMISVQVEGLTPGFRAARAPRQLARAQRMGARHAPRQKV